MKKLLTLGTLLVATSAMAGFNSNQQAGGFNQTAQGQTMTVAQALKAQDNSIVSLKGKIVRQVDNDEFIFSDGTAEIKIDVEDSAWAGQNVTPNDTIVIEGKIDNERFEKTDMDVFRITKQ